MLKWCSPQHLPELIVIRWHRYSRSLCQKMRFWSIHKRSWCQTGFCDFGKVYQKKAWMKTTHLEKKNEKDGEGNEGPDHRNHSCCQDFVPWNPMLVRRQSIMLSFFTMFVFLAINWVWNRAIDSLLWRWHQRFFFARHFFWLSVNFPKVFNHIALREV